MYNKLDWFPNTDAVHRTGAELPLFPEYTEIIRCVY